MTTRNITQRPECHTCGRAAPTGKLGKTDRKPTYTLLDGDTWDSVAAALGVSVDDLKAANSEIDELA